MTNPRLFISSLVILVIVIHSVYAQEAVDSLIFKTSVEDVTYEFFVNGTHLKYSAIKHERDTAHVNNRIKGLSAQRRIKNEEWNAIDSMLQNLSHFEFRSTTGRSRFNRRSTTSFYNAVDFYQAGKLIGSYRYPTYPPTTATRLLREHLLKCLKTSNWSHWNEAELTHNYIKESDKINLFKYTDQKLSKEGKRLSHHQRTKKLSTLTDSISIGRINDLISDSPSIDPLHRDQYSDICSGKDYHFLEFHKGDTHLRTVYLYEGYFRQYFGNWKKVKLSRIEDLFSQK